MKAVFPNICVAVVLAGALFTAGLTGCGPEPAGDAGSPTHSTPNPAMPADNGQSEQPAASGDGGSGEKSDSDSDAGSANAAAEIKVRVGDEKELQAMVARHAGKVVLVDFWATWCGPCVQEFPHTVELSRHNPDELVVIAVSMDEPDDEASVREFLKKHDVKFENLISKYGVGQEGFGAFDITNGAIPHYKIYDRQGKLRHSLDGNEGIDALIDELIAEKGEE